MREIAPSDLQKLYATAAGRIGRFGAQWKIDEAFARETVAHSVKSWGGLDRGESVEDYLESLRADDLALTIACRAGVAAAWETFIEKYRPTLYASARASCREESAAREIADSMWAELYGVDAKGAQRRSLLDYFHGRSSLATWLRAIVAQRHIDSVRGARRFEPLEDAPPQVSRVEAGDPPEPGHARIMEIFAAVLSAAIAALAGKDRLRLGYYYRDELTLRQIARATGEHESTVSRNLERTRRELRKNVERELRRTHRMSTEQIQLCFEHAASDAPFKFNAPISPLGAGVITQKKEPSSFRDRG
jgi:RNA polymerase sigma-70 factor (ECF subfamily)